MNFSLRLWRNSFRVFVHPMPEIDALFRANGFERRYSRETFLWQVLAYARQDDAAIPATQK